MCIRSYRGNDIEMGEVVVPECSGIIPEIDEVMAAYVEQIEKYPQDKEYITQYAKEQLRLVRKRLNLFRALTLLDER